MDADKRKILYIVGGVFGFLLFFYLISIVSQLIAMSVDSLIPGPVGIPKEPLPLSIGPLSAGAYLFSNKYPGITFGVFVIFVLLIAFALFIRYSRNDELKDERGFDFSSGGTYGTARWMKNDEIEKIMELKEKAEDVRGTILGKRGKMIVERPDDRIANRHTAVYGASGSGKSFCYVRPYMAQCIERGESMIITDPKGELCEDFKEHLTKEGYDVKMFNLVNPYYSDSWNCIDEILGDPHNFELYAQILKDVIVKNTGGGDPFFDGAMGMYLLSGILYVSTMYDVDKTVKPTLGSAYEFMTKTPHDQLCIRFQNLPDNHPAKHPWAIVCKASEKLMGNINFGFGSALQVFQTNLIKQITTRNDIDITAPGKKKCAYFVIMSDQNSTLDFLSTLFFTFMFIKLVNYADARPDKKCEIPVHFILDEFPNIGSIPDFVKKISVIRSRDLRVSVIFQNIAQLQNRYPNGQWEEIIGNCDTQLFLACSDYETASFISRRSGEVTIQVASESSERSTLEAIHMPLKYRESRGLGKRMLLTPDEVMRLPKNECLVIMTAQNVLKLNKFPFSEHPLSSKIRSTPIADHKPKWWDTSNYQEEAIWGVRKPYAWDDEKKKVVAIDPDFFDGEDVAVSVENMFNTDPVPKNVDKIASKNNFANKGNESSVLFTAPINQTKTEAQPQSPQPAKTFSKTIVKR